MSEVTESKQNAGPRWRRAVVPVVLFLVGVVGLSLPAWKRVLAPSPHFHFVDLAESFMAGRLDTDTPRQRRGTKQKPEDPPGYRAAIDRHLTGADDKSIGFNDWASFRVLGLKGDEEVKGVFPWKDAKEEDANWERRKEFHLLDGQHFMVIDKNKDIARTCGKSGRGRCDDKKHYVSFPPFPAVAVLPFAAIWHYDFNDVLFTILLGAANLVLIFLLLQSLKKRGWSDRSTRENIALALLFTFGTVHYFSAVRGEVWFTALIMGVTLNIAFIWAALDTRRPLLAGLFLALGMATRTPIAFCFVFFALQLLFPGGRWSGSSFMTKLKKGVLFALPILTVGGLLIAYNYARFEKPFEFGHAYLLEGARASIRDHGLFSTHFLNHNLSCAFVNLPRLLPSAPFVEMTRHGVSLLFTTPFFFYLLWPRKTDWTKADRFRHLALWLTVVVVAVPLLLYQNSGWAQFGYRFALDFMPYLFVLLAMSRRRLTKTAYVVMTFCVLVNLFGAITFGRVGMFFYD